MLMLGKTAVDSLFIGNGGTVPFHLGTRSCDQRLKHSKHNFEQFSEQVQSKVPDLYIVNRISQAAFNPSINT